MDLNGLNVFNMLKARMNWLNSRQSVLAQNVANADTPNFIARDLQPMDFKSVLQQSKAGLSLAATDVAHLTPRGEQTQAGSAPVRGKYETTPSGNAVVLEEEMMKSTETAGQYQLMSNLYAKHLSLLKIAIGSGRG